MTVSRFDLIVARPGKEKTYWLKIGSMFPARKGDGFAIKLDALPIPNEKGEIWINAAVPQERDAEPRQQAGGAAKGHAPSRADLDDDIPF
jgi:hypothetical protein